MYSYSISASLLCLRSVRKLHSSTARRLSTHAHTASQVEVGGKRYQELCNMSYWQNELLSGFEMEPLPRLQVDAVPIVHHPLYSAPRLQQGHRFPMQIFQVIHDTLRQDEVVMPEQVRCNPLILLCTSIRLAH